MKNIKETNNQINLSYLISDLCKDIYDTSLTPRIAAYSPLNYDNCRIFKVKGLTYEKEFPRKEAFEQVVSSINHANCRLFYYLKGTKNGVEFYIGVVDNQNKSNKNSLAIHEYGKMLSRAFKGNFLGSSLSEELDNSEIQKITRELSQSDMKYSSILGIPKGEQQQKDINFQSIDRLVNIMTSGGSDHDDYNFHLIVVWEPINQSEITNLKKEIYNLSDDVFPFVESSLGVGYQNGNNVGLTSGYNKSETRGNSKNTTNNYNASVSHAYSNGTNTSHSISDTSGWNKGESGTEGENNSKNSAKKSHGTSKSKTNNTGESHSHSTSYTEGSSTNSSDTTNYGFSTGNTSGESSSESDGESSSVNVSSSNSSNFNTNIKQQNKAARDIYEYIDKEMLPRLKTGMSKGMYRTCVYVGAKSTSELTLLENAMVSICQGNELNFNAMHSYRLPNEKYIRDIISNLEIIKNIRITDTIEKYLPFYSKIQENGKTCIGQILNSNEISLLAGMPQKEVPGLNLHEQVPFGLNIDRNKQKEPIILGRMMQEGNELSCHVTLDAKDLSKHIFIAGTTGAGKTTTCHRLLSEAKCPFLVIEPAKTEYRALLNDKNFRKDLIIFTIGNETGIPFRLNPFEFLPTENISSHVDILKACFMASFDMEAAIPNLLEEGLYLAYQRFGWNLKNNTNVLLENRDDAWDASTGGMYFPTINDYIKIVNDLVDSKGFDERLKNDYKGSINARLGSLCAGQKELMFNVRRSVDFIDLIDKKVIFELEDLKSGDDKAFFIGLILGKLVESLKYKHKKDPSFKHITLIEEAHRLLSKTLPGDNSNRRLGVEMFADMLAEVRKYGESLIIVDQIPNKLSPEVLKNTNTKIIHKIFSRDDKEVVGDTMALNDKQKNYLSYLMPGEAIVFSQGWRKPIDVKITQLDCAKTNDEDISEEMVIDAGWKYWLSNPHLICNSIAYTDTKYTKEELRTISYCTKELLQLPIPFTDYQMIKQLKDILKDKFEVVIGTMYKEYLLTQSILKVPNKNPLEVKEIYQYLMDNRYGDFVSKMNIIDENNNKEIIEYVKNLL